MVDGMGHTSAAIWFIKTVLDVFVGPVMAMPLPDKEVDWPEQQEWFTQVLERMFQEQEHVIQHLGTLRKNALELFGEVLRPCSKIVRGNGGRIQ